MERFNNNFFIENGADLYKEDFEYLEKVLKYGDTSSNYGVNITDDILFVYNVKYSKDNREVTKRFGSMSEIGSHNENIEIEFLSVEKAIFEKGNMKQMIEIKLSKNYITVSLMSEDIIWIKYQRYLLEDFFSQRQLKSGKYNNWISEKLPWYSSLVAGGLGGAGFGLNETSLIIAGGALIFISGSISYPGIKNKIFPKNKISFKERPEKENAENKINKFKSFINEGILAVSFGLVTAFIVYLVSKLF